MASNLGPKISMTMHGLNGLRITLNTLPEKIAANVLSAAVAKGAKVCLKEARERVLVAKSDYSGTVVPGLLKRSLRATRGKRRGYEASAYVSVRRLSAKAIMKFKKATGKAAAYNPLDPFYWSILEFGKSERTAHPFIRPAFEAKKVEAAQAIQAEIAKGLEKEVNKLRSENANK